MLRFSLRTRGLTVGLLTFLYGMGVHSQAPPTALPSDPLIFVGSGPGGGVVSVFQADGTPVVSVSPFGGGFSGGVRVAAGDVNGDGVTDVVAGMASGGGEVRAFSGVDGTSLGTSAPFGAGFTGGVFVATGDVNADGHDDILLGAGPGGGLARLIDGATLTELGSGLPFPVAYTGGVTVAMGDVNGDGRADLIVGTAIGGFVRVFDGPTLTEVVSGFPYGPLFLGGVNVASGDINGDGIDEVAIAPRNAGGPVRVYTVQAELIAEGNVFSGVQGVSLALTDLNADGRDDLVVGAGAGAQPRVRAFSVVDRTQLLDLLAFDAAFTGGVVVATPSSTGTRFTNANAATFTAGVAGSFTVTTSNGTDTVLSVGGTLPAGVTFTDDGNGTGTLAGTPAVGTGGAYALNFVATRAAGQVASQPFTLTIQEGAGISSADNAVFAIGGTNVFSVTTTGHPAPATIAVTGLLPGGVTFTNNGNGSASLTGSPSAGSEGAYPVTLTASNGVGSPATQAFTLTVVAGSTPLFSSADATTFTVGAVGSFSVLTSATPIASTITVTGTLPTGVTFTDHGNGTATLAGVPDTGTAGTYPLTFTADNGVATTPQSFTLTVDPIAGGAPSFTSGNTITFVIGTAGAFTATTTGFPIAATVTSSGALPAGLTFTNNGDGTATLAGTADPGTAGSYPLQFTADNGVGTATQLFTLTINNVSASPVFTSGATSAFVIGTNGTFAITTAASPVVSAIAVTGALPTGVIFTDHVDGTASLDGTPQPGTAGPYPLTFTATNGVGAPVDQAFTLSVQEIATITSANARAFTVGIADSFTVTTTGLPVPSVALTTGTLPTGVTHTDNGDGTATIAGTAAAGTVGSYPLTLTATNGVGTPGTQLFTLAVTQNTPPTLDAIPDPTAILEDATQQTINLTGITAGIGDTQPLQVTALSSDTNVIPAPTVTYVTPAATGTLQYTPVANAFGTAIVTVTVTDGGLDNDLGTAGDNGVTSRTFTVAVTAVNDPPTLDTIADPAAIDEDAAQQTINLTGIGTGGGETQTLQITAISGNTALIPDPTVTYTAPAATGSLAYTPVAGESGSALITVIVTDGGDDDDLGTLGDNLTQTRTFTVVVNDVDDPPTLGAIPDPTAIDEDAGLQTISLSGISAGAGETATLVVTAVSGNPALIPNPAVTYTSPDATGSLTYTPVANTSGSAVITVTVSDGGATPTPRTFTVLVNDVNDAPTFTPGGNQTVSEDAAAQTVNSFLGTVAAGANEAGQIVTVTINNVTTPSLFSVAPAISATGVLTYTPAAEQFGVSTVIYTVSDNGGTANGGVDSVGPLTFTITINAVNDPPTLNAIGDPAAILEDAAQQTINLAGIGTGSSGESAQPLQVTAVSNDTAVIPNPTVTYVSPNTTGTLDYTPVANAFGAAVITVTVIDGGLDDDLDTAGDNGTVVRTFTVNVTGVNDAPSFTKGSDQTVLEDAVAQTVNPWATSISAGPGEGAQILTFEIIGNTNPSLFSAGPSVSPTTGALTYTPTANQNGAATITLQITDNGGTTNGGTDASATQTFVITVTAVNDAPVAQAKSYDAQANMPISGLSGLLAGVTDADSGINGCTPIFSVAGVSATTPPGGNVTNLNAAAGTFDFNPPPGAVGPVTFTYTVSDTGCPGTATSAAATVTINVAGPVIWFVDPAAGSNGDGRLGTPFNTLASAAAVDAASHRIFIYSGTATSGIALNVSEWLIGQGATNAPNTFDALMGIAPPSGTITRPSIGGARPTVQGTATLESNARVQGLNISPAAASMGINDPAGTISGVTVQEVSVTTTSAPAINLTNADGAFSFTAISTNGGANGVVWSNAVQATGSFIVNGSGTTDGSGGTIQNTTTRGASFINARNVTLKNMNFTNAATADFPAGPTGLSLGNNTGDNAAIHLQVVTAVVLDNLNINGSAEQGINGHNVSGFTLSNSVLSGLGNDADEDGLHFFNMLGTASISNTSFTSSGDDNVNIQNNTNLALPSGMTAVTTLTITGGNANTGVLGSGYLMGIRGTSNTTVTVDGVTANNNFSGGIVIDTYDTATSVIEIENSTSTNNNDGISLSSHNGSTKFDIHDNVSFAGTDFGRINVLKSAFSTTGILEGRIRNNPIVVTDGQTADGVFVFHAGGGTLRVAITGNTFDYRGTQRALLLQGGQDGAASLHATVTGNAFDVKLDGTGNAVTGILAQVAVTSPEGDSSSMCADIGGAGALANVFTHSLGGTMAAGDLRVRQRFVTTVTLPGYGGANNNDAAVVAYLAGRNVLVSSPAATATNEAGVTAGAGGFVNGSCQLPAFP